MTIPVFCFAWGVTKSPPHLSFLMQCFCQVQTHALCRVRSSVVPPQPPLIATHKNMYAHNAYEERREKILALQSILRFSLSRGQTSFPPGKNMARGQPDKAARARRGGGSIKKQSERDDASLQKRWNLQKIPLKNPPPSLSQILPPLPPGGGQGHASLGFRYMK